MKINNLKVNSYGKIKDKEINFKDGINIVYGDNEKGKSTLLNFIVNMFYGSSKTKKGKEISDFEKFKPWDTEEFSGKMKYTLDDNSSYEVFREFGKKNPQIYNERLDEITKEFTIDKTNGSQFFLEQTNVDEQTFCSSVAAFQNEVEIDKQTQNSLLQKIANVSSTGEENISYKKAIDKLNKKQLEEIGTTRSQEKPINIVMKEISNLNAENENLKQYQNYKYEIEDLENKLKSEISDMDVKEQFLKDINRANQSEIVEKEKLKYTEKKIDDIEDKIQNILKEKDKVQEKVKSIHKYQEEKVNKLPYIIGITVAVIIAVIILLVTKVKVLSIVPIVIGIVVTVIMITKISNCNKMNKTKKEDYEKILNENNNIQKNVYELNAQINVLENNKNEQVVEAENIKNEIIRNIELSKEKIKNQYSSKIDYSELDRYYNLDNMNSTIEMIQKSLNEKNLELHRLRLNKENILPKLEKIAENEEKLVSRI